MSAITLLPLGTADRSLVETLHAPLASTFRAAVKTVTCDVELEEVYDPDRVQYNSSALLARMKTWRPPKGGENGKLLGVVSRDLYIPILTFVFGEAELGGHVAVVSYHRLQNELYGLPPDPALLATRLRKEAIHELGHTFGLVHCSLQDCVMHTSTYVEDIDLKSDRVCEGCEAEISGRRNRM